MNNYHNVYHSLNILNSHHNTEYNQGFKKPVRSLYDRLQNHLKTYPAPLTKAVSITDEAIEKRFPTENVTYNQIEINTNCQLGAKWARDLMLSRNVISIQRKKLSSHLIEGEQRKPLDFEEFLNTHAKFNILPSGLEPEDAESVIKSRYEAYLIGFKQ